MPRELWQALVAVEDLRAWSARVQLAAQKAYLLGFGGQFVQAVNDLAATHNYLEHIMRRAMYCEYTPWCWRHGSRGRR